MKICVKCSLEKEEKDFYKCARSRDGLNSWCKLCNNEHGVKKYRKGSPKKIKQAKNAYYLKNKEVCLAKTSQWRLNNLDRHKELNNRSRLKLRKQVIEAYGSSCVCCGEKILQFLSIDHINNDGALHRKTLSDSMLYTWLRKNNFPKDNYQLLCMNCNFAKGKYGKCPHNIGV